jgi:hypothetical protein
MIEHLTSPWTAAVGFQSASPAIVKSVKQLDLLNIWLRAFARLRALPRLEDYKPDRIADELPDLMTFEVVGEGEHARFFITHEGTRLTSVYGSEHIQPDKRINRYLDDAVGPVRYRRIVPFYRACLATGRPSYSISMVRDADGKEVSYERLLLPFGGATAIDHIVGSYKAISIEGGFKIRDLMGARADNEPVSVISAVIDREIVRGNPSDRIADDLEFS